MSDRFARITLLEQFVNDSGQAIDRIGLRYGSEPARLAGSYYTDPATGADAVMVSPMPDSTGRPTRMIPGEPIRYFLNWADEDYRVAVVPDYVARHYFGDWTIKPGEWDRSTPERNFNAEKDRVARIWGDYKKEAWTRDMNWRGLKKVSPPCVPKVQIQLLDGAQRAIPGSLYIPWEHFNWAADCIEIAGSVTPTPAMVLPDQITPQMQELIKQEAARLFKEHMAEPRLARKAV
jgi:hypothetical protein